MDLTPTLPTAIYAIWWATLAVVVLVIVPLAVILLHRTLRAALAIRRYLAEMLEAGVGIANNTSSISALNDTIKVAGGLVATATSIKAHSGTIVQVLGQRAAAGRAP
jgi:hypothetical protein